MIFIKHQSRMFHSGVKNVIHISKATWGTVICVTQRHITVDVTKSQINACQLNTTVYRCEDHPLACAKVTLKHTVILAI